MTRAAKKPRPDALDRLLAHVDKFSVPSNGHGYDSSLDAAKRKTRRLVAALLRERADAAEGAARCYPTNRHAEAVVAAVLRRPRRKEQR